jgi:hypothetical protein
MVSAINFQSYTLVLGLILMVFPSNMLFFTFKNIDDRLENYLSLKLKPIFNVKNVKFDSVNHIRLCLNFPTKTANLSQSWIPGFT